MSRRVHLSLLVSISPNNSLLPPLLALPTEVAEPVDEMVEKEDEGLVTSGSGDGLSCLQLMLCCQRGRSQ